ncbi:hypothetical protein GQ43DRAFT_427897 [Delitschia confertaspora ATCC 74209]|uniref:Cytochrome P450 n=1 Tax=Delitschia confertaspora ATCC 74209 TaxID=1513339 RepID=A0A9P4JUS6_9PLEO|nr:hypothetical protein GQ43DRAFT_427897 [Delitschia confertaspora ATCC 74209]
MHRQLGKKLIKSGGPQVVKAANDAVWLNRIQEAEYLQQIRGVLGGGDKDKTSRITIFHETINDPGPPPDQTSEKRMVAEVEALVGVDTLTSTHMLSLTSYFVLVNPEILKSPLAELGKAVPDPTSSPSQQAFESLSYLNAAMDEDFRLSYGSMHRLSRSHPKESLKFHD